MKFVAGLEKDIIEEASIQEGTYVSHISSANVNHSLDYQK
jgi:hypothetical protein